MPFLDVSDLMVDPDFWEGGLICARSSQVIGANGLAVDTPLYVTFGGVVTQISGSELQRNAVGELITGSILICTRFRLRDGKAGYTADVVQRDDRYYTVVNVLPYSKFGLGFIEATCDLKPLGGSVPPPPGYPPRGGFGDNS